MALITALRAWQALCAWRAFFNLHLRLPTCLFSLDVALGRGNDMAGVSIAISARRRRGDGAEAALGRGARMEGLWGVNQPPPGFGHRSRSAVGERGARAMASGCGGLPPSPTSYRSPGRSPARRAALLEKTLYTSGDPITAFDAPPRRNIMAGKHAAAGATRAYMPLPAARGARISMHVSGGRAWPVSLARRLDFCLPPSTTWHDISIACH